MRGFLLIAVLAAGAAAASEPFPAALDAAAVEQDRLDDLNTRALVLGNGDLNALLWDRGGALALRVTKNDLWDARIDTSKDPALLTMDIAARKWSGGTGQPPSWHDHPYPQPRCAAVVTIGGTPADAGWTCVRTAAQHEWVLKDGLGIMAVAGAQEASAGYGLPLPPAGAKALALRLSGTPNARYFVNVTDAAGQDLVRSGWVDTPPAETDVVFSLPADRPTARLEVYVMSRDGQRAENRFRVIGLGAGGETKLPLGMAATRARLDLRRAVATVNDTTVRALADRNVFLIETPGEVALEENKAPQLPPAARGETEGVKWLHMAMPGDVDYRGMEYALAVATRGGRKAVSLVTSFDTKEPVREAAIRLARETLAAEPTALVAAHETDWAKFWSASGVELADRFFQDAWYRNLYYLRCFCRAGTTMPITLYAGLANDAPGWHGAPTLDYNIQQVFWPMFVCNQVELMEPYVRFLADSPLAPAGWRRRRMGWTDSSCP